MKKFFNNSFQILHLAIQNANIKVHNTKTNLISTLEKQLLQQYAGVSNGIYLLTNSNSHYVQWFGLVLIENALHYKTWTQTTLQQRVTTRQTLLRVLEKWKQVSVVIWKKVCQVLCKIAKFEYPNEYPEFMNQVFAICKVM